MTDITVTEARATLPELLERVDAGEELTLTRHGRPVAVLVRPDRLRARSVGPAHELTRQLHAELSDARQRRTPAGTCSPDRTDQLVAEVRADRDR